MSCRLAAFLLIAFTLCGLAAPSRAQRPAAPQPETSRIAQINIIDHSPAVVSSDTIRAVMAEEVGDQYDPAAAEKDRQAIKAMGYFNGDIGLDASPDPSGGVDLTFTWSRAERQHSNT